MTREELRHIASRWIAEGDHAPVPEIWRLRIADVCAGFAEFIYGECLRRESVAMKLAEDAINGTLPAPIIVRNSCNRHDDCSKANEEVRAKGGLAASHCHDECCEDCFGS